MTLPFVPGDEQRAALVEEVAREAVGRRIEWHLEPLPTLMGDAGLLRQVFVNLLGNAVKFTASRDPAVIRVALSPVQNRVGECVIRVSDNGAGFDMRYAGQLFGPFQRLHSQREFPGTGVGLANVKRILQRHGGTVWAESTPGEGARFFLSLPVPA